VVKLFAENPNLSGPVAAFRWCVDKDTLNKLKEIGVAKPFILLTIAHGEEYGVDDGDEKSLFFKCVDTKVVPLDQAMEYLEFDRPGRHRIFASLVWVDGRSQRDRLVQHFRKNSTRRDLVCGSNLSEDSDFIKYELGYGSIDVVVPDGHFAAEPRAWEKWWVNLWFDDGPDNQCHFRKRRMLAYSIQPPIVLIWASIRGLIVSLQIVASLLAGMRGIKYRAIWHPFTFRIGDWDCLPYTNRSSFFVSNSSGADRHPLVTFFMPWIQLAFFGIVTALVACSRVVGFTFSWWLVAKVFVVLVLAIVVSPIIVYWVGKSAGIEFWGFIEGIAKKIEESKEKRTRQILDETYAAYGDVIGCNAASLSPSLSSLPEGRRTVYLRFKAFKARVCLPYAK